MTEHDRGRIASFASPQPGVRRLRSQAQGGVHPAPGRQNRIPYRVPLSLPYRQPPGPAFALTNTLGELRLSPTPKCGVLHLQFQTQGVVCPAPERAGLSG